MSHEALYVSQRRGNCRQAFEFYAEHLGGNITMPATHGEQPDASKGPPNWKDAVLHGRIELNNTVLMGADIPPDRCWTPAVNAQLAIRIMTGACMRRHFTVALVASVVAVAACAGPSPQALRRQPLPLPPPMPSPTRSGTFRINGAQLYYAVFDAPGTTAGAPVVLLHGGYGDGEIWAAEINRLASSHQVIVLDTRGHGRSTRSATPFSYALFASDVVGVLDSLHLPRAAIVGWSDGGITGLVLAMKYPARVAGVLTYGANFDHSGEIDSPSDSVQGARFRTRVAASYRRLSPTPDDFAGLGRALSAMYRVEPALTRRDLGTIRAPTTIVAGEFEQFISRDHSETLARSIPGAKLVILPRVNHGGPLQDPDRFHQVVMTFLNRPEIRELR